MLNDRVYNPSVQAQISMYVITEIEAQKMRLADICQNYGIRLNIALYSMGYGQPTEILKHAICRELGFSSWDELTQAALSADA